MTCREFRATVVQSHTSGNSAPRQLSVRIAFEQSEFDISFSTVMRCVKPLDGPGNRGGRQLGSVKAKTVEDLMSLMQSFMRAHIVVALFTIRPSACAEIASRSAGAFTHARLAAEILRLDFSVSPFDAAGNLDAFLTLFTTLKGISISSNCDSQMRLKPTFLRFLCSQGVPRLHVHSHCAQSFIANAEILDFLFCGPTTQEEGQLLISEPNINSRFVFELTEVSAYHFSNLSHSNLPFLFGVYRLFRTSTAEVSRYFLLAIFLFFSLRKNLLLYFYNN